MRSLARSRAARQHATKDLPPRISADHDELRSSSAYGCITKVRKINNSKAQLTLEAGGGKPVRTLTCYFDSLQCECGVPKIDEKPCVHMLKACDDLGVDVRDVLHELDTYSHWQKQYDPDSIGQVSRHAKVNI